MRDRVMALVADGGASGFLNSSPHPHQYALALERAGRGRRKLIYVAPERLTSPLSWILPYRPGSICWRWTRPCISQGARISAPAYLEIPGLWPACPADGRGWLPPPPASEG